MTTDFSQYPPAVRAALEAAQQAGLYSEAPQAAPVAAQPQYQAPPAAPAYTQPVQVPPAQVAYAAPAPNMPGMAVPNLPAVNPTASSAVATQTHARGPALGFDTVTQGQPLPVEGFFLNTHEAAGMSVKWGDEDPRSATYASFYFKDFEADLDSSQISFCRAIKWTVMGKTEYRKSYDGQVDAGTGHAWGSIIAQAKAMDPQCQGDYPSADIILVLTNPLVDAAGTVVLKAGEALKYSFSTTNFANLYKAISRALDEGFITRNADTGKLSGTLNIRFEHFTKIFKKTGKPGGMTRLVILGGSEVEEEDEEDMQVEVAKPTKSRKTAKSASNA